MQQSDLYLPFHELQLSHILLVLRHFYLKILLMGGLLIYTTIFFIIVFALTVTESKITDLIGKILNPIFLLFLFLIFFLAFLTPIGLKKHQNI